MQPFEAGWGETVSCLWLHLFDVLERRRVRVKSPVVSMSDRGHTQLSRTRIAPVGPPMTEHIGDMPKKLLW
ncbi:MAG: hypothetical protein EpisKO_06460 [Epibacterium sp.]